MRRRHLLGSTVAAATTLLMPSWLKEAFGDAAVCDSKDPASPPSAIRSAAAFSVAFARARQARTALLVIVIPASDSAKYHRGRVWGELLNFGGDADLAPLASVEVVCAKLADVKTVVPNSEEESPLFLIIATDKLPASVRAFDAKLPGAGDHARTWDLSPNGIDEAKEDDLVNPRIAALAALLKSALGAPGSDVAGAAREARARLKDLAPMETHWATRGVCRVLIEGVEDNRVLGCGMGYVPERSRRFLLFYSLSRGLP